MDSVRLGFADYVSILVTACIRPTHPRDKTVRRVWHHVRQRRAVTWTYMRIRTVKLGN